MDTKDSKINREVGKQLKREQSVTLSVRELADRTGISEATINRMWSKAPRDINITQITWMAALMDVEPIKLISDAIERAGGLEAIMAELHEAMSVESATTDDLEKRRAHKAAELASPAEIDRLATAATRDEYMDQDEDS